MSLARAAAPLLLFASACDETIVVGTNDVGQLVSPQSCGPDAPFLACSTRSCVVSQLSAAQLGRETVAVDATHVYFATSEFAIGRVPKSGGTPVDIATGVERIERLTIDAEDLYWTDPNGQVFRVPKDGGAAPVVATSLMANPVSIVNDATHLYLAMPGSGEIAMVEKPEGTPTLLAGQGTPIDMGIDGKHVWWIDEGTPGAATGKLVRVPRGDLASPEIVRTDLEDPLALGVTSTSILWATYDKVFRLARDGGTPRVFVGDFGEPKGLAELDGVVYLASVSGLHRIDLATGTPLVLDARGMTALTLGCEGLYAVGWFESILVRYGR